jgi:hypothetical protein
MSKNVTGVIVFTLLTGFIWGGSEITFTSVSDLKKAIHSPRALDVVRNPNAWLPELVASLRWKTQLSEHFVLHYHIDASDEQDLLFDSLLMELEKLYSELLEFLEIEAGSKPEQLALKTRLACFIVKTHSERTFGTLPDPHLLFYLLDPEKDPDYMLKLRHELAHWVWGRVYVEAPPLFNEGVAVYAEKMSPPGTTESEFLANAAVDRA